MTKKSAAKRDARARQAKLGGRYMHHHHVAGGGDLPGPWNRKLTMETVIALARQSAPVEVARAVDEFGDQPFVYVAGDVSEPLGEVIAAVCLSRKRGMSRQVALGELRANVVRRHEKNGNLPFGGVMTASDLAAVLQRTFAPQQIHAVVQLVARFSSAPPPDHVHVLGVAGGEVLATIIPMVPVCACGHSLREHSATGACTWFGVPDGRPILGLPVAMAEQARALGVPMKCPCAGEVGPTLDASAGRSP